MTSQPHCVKCCETCENIPCQPLNRVQCSHIAALSVLDELHAKANQRQMDVETEDGQIIEVIEKGEVLAWIESLRSNTEAQR